MKVTFSKSDGDRLCTWRTEPPRRRPFQGSAMASHAGHIDLPHDLAQFVVEASLGLEHGFWNLVANGATFKSIGRRRTRLGRQLIGTYRGGLNAAESAGNAHVQAWREWPTRHLPAASPRTRPAATRRRGRCVGGGA
jgi:hypothetical protein